MSGGLWRACRNKCSPEFCQRTPALVPFTALSLSCPLLNGSAFEVLALMSWIQCGPVPNTSHMPVLLSSCAGTCAMSWTTSQLKKTGQTCKTVGKHTAVLMLFHAFFRLLTVLVYRAQHGQLFKKQDGCTSISA